MEVTKSNFLNWIIHKWNWKSFLLVYRIDAGSAISILTCFDPSNGITGYASWPISILTSCQPSNMSKCIFDTVNLFNDLLHDYFQTHTHTTKYSTCSPKNTI